MPQKQDPFREVPHREDFAHLIEDVWKKRLEVSEINQNVNAEEHKEPACELELSQVLGRRAFDRRNNV